MHALWWLGFKNESTVCLQDSVKIQYNELSPEQFSDHSTSGK